MGFDLFQSRRNFNERCRWWVRNESDKYEDNSLVYRRSPSGYFYAKEVNAETKGDNVVGSVFMMDKTTVTIMSPDDLTALGDEKSRGDIANHVLVEYQGELWRVEDVQKRKAKMQNGEFGNPQNMSHFWYLSLIKG